jgi:hypothetical protein
MLLISATQPRRRQRDVRDRRIQGLHEGGEDHAGGHRGAIADLGRSFARGHPRRLAEPACKEVRQAAGVAGANLDLDA